MRKVKGFVWVFLLLVQYFWLFVFAYESPPDIPITEDVIIEEEIVQDDVLAQEETSVQEEEPPIDILDNPTQDTQAEEEIEDAILITEEEPEVSLNTTDVDTVDTGNVVPDPVVEEMPLLLITEVAFAGTQEWIELYNPHDTVFSATIEIVGARSSPVVIQNLTVPAKSTRIIARQAGVDSMVDTSIIDSIHTLSMPDSTALHITIAVDGEIIDTFSASVSLMNQANKSTSDRSSLQRTLDDISVVHVSSTQQNYNNNSTMNINPGIVYHSVDELPPAACNDRWSVIQIREVFRWSETHTPYIELFAPQGFSQTITISGTQIIEDFDIFISQPAGHYHVVSIPENNYTNHPHTTDNQKLSFGSELGNIVIYGQDGQVLDKVDIQVREDGYSSYIRGTWCQRVGDVVDNFSPGFARDYLSYFPEGAEKIITITEQIVIPGEPQQCDDPIWEDDPEDDSIPEEVQSIPPSDLDDIALTITHIGYQWPTTGKTITLYMTGATGLDLAWFYILTNGTTKRNLQGIIREHEPLTLTGSWWFAATQPRCVELFHNNTADKVFSTYCYDPIEDAKRKGDIEITNIVYQTAPGSSIRKLHLFVPQWELDLSKDRYIMINTTKRNLASYGMISWHVVLEGMFPFPKTSNTCVELRQYDKLFDTYCYEVPQNTTTSTKEPFQSVWLSYPIRIDHIGYQWPTTGKSITLSMQGWSPVDLSHFHILINKTTKRNLRGTLEPNKSLTLTGSLGFASTQARCIELFHKEHLFDTYCYDPVQDKIEEQEARKYSGSITITDVIYHTDDEHPDQRLLLSASGADIIFAHERYLMINNRKFSLKSFDTGSWDMVLTGNFRFPKTVSSCVSLWQYEEEFSQYCYDPKAKKDEIVLETETYTWVHLEILSLLPNPIGPDAGKERVDILLHSPDGIDLSHWFSILINGRTKRAISWNPIAGEIYRLTGSFTLPNTASCVSLLYIDTLLDTFCYPQTKEGIIYNKNAQTLLALTDAELTLLNTTKLTRFNNRLCLTLSDVTIKCRAVPAGKLATRQMEELKLSRNYITMLHNYLYNHWQLIYFNSDIISYKTLFDASKKDIGWSKFTRSYGSERLPISDIQTRFQLQYQQPLLQQLQWHITSKIFGPKLAQNYKKAKERYYKNTK